MPPELTPLQPLGGKQILSMERPNRTYPHEPSGPRAAVARLTERQKTILEALIRAYVAAAEPVASSKLVRQYRLPYSSATVRSELQALDKIGLVTQPHTSAGRVPTGKGYRFFIRYLIHGDGVLEREERRLRVLGELADPFEFMRGASRLLAELTRNFAVAGFPGEAHFYKSGIRDVLAEPEFSDHSLMQEFSSLVDHIEEELAREFDPTDFGEPRTFIGRENPIRAARRCGMIVSAYETPFGRESIIALVGPMRMDYEHNLALLKHVREIMNS